MRSRSRRRASSGQAEVHLRRLSSSSAARARDPVRWELPPAYRDTYAALEHDWRFRPRPRSRQVYAIKNSLGRPRLANRLAYPKRIGLAGGRPEREELPHERVEAAVKHDFVTHEVTSLYTQSVLIRLVAPTARTGAMKPEILFVESRKIHRLNRETVITEKIDGTNAQIYINDTGDRAFAGSRSVSWITLEDDNFLGFGALGPEHLR